MIVHFLGEEGESARPGFVPFLLTPQQSMLNDQHATSL